MFIRSLLCFSLICLFACDSKTVEEDQKVSQRVLKALCEDLHVITTLDQLVQKTPKLKKSMRLLVQLMIQADEHHYKSSEKSENKVSLVISDQLQYEIQRLCEQVEGAQELLEELQEEMLDKLDVYERKKGKLRSE